MEHNLILSRKPKSIHLQRAYAKDAQGRLLWLGTVYKSKTLCRLDIQHNAPELPGGSYGVSHILKHASHFPDQFFNLVTA